MNLKLDTRPDHMDHARATRLWRADTDVAQAEETAQRLASRHSRLLAVMPAGVVVLDGEGRVQESNAAAIALLGEPLDGQRWIDIIDRAFSPRPGDGHDVSLKDGRLVHISTSPLVDEPGQLVLLTDVSETRALQQKVSHMQRLSAMGEVAARLAHQIRTPLSSALLYLSPLLREEVDDDTRQRFAGRIRDSLSHMEQLIRDLLAFSRGDLAAPAPVVVDTLLADAAQQFKAQPGADQYQFTLHNEVGDGHVYGSRSALASALNNLLTNARQACGDHGRITLAAAWAEDEDGTLWIDLSVEDNGCGIAAADRDRILAPFYTTRATGTGLGLAAVQAIVKAHRGRLWLDSQPGEGSLFCLRLPIYRAATTSVAGEALS